MSNDDKDEAPGILPYVIVGIGAVIVSMLLAYLLSVLGPWLKDIGEVFLTWAARTWKAA